MCVYCTKNVHLFGYKCTGVSDPNPYPNPNPHTTPYPNHNRIIASNTSGPRPHTHLNTVCLLSDALTSLFCILSYLVLSCLGLPSSWNSLQTEHTHTVCSVCNELQEERSPRQDKIKWTHLLSFLSMHAYSNTTFNMQGNSCVHFPKARFIFVCTRSLISSTGLFLLAGPALFMKSNSSYTQIWNELVLSFVSFLISLDLFLLYLVLSCLILSGSSFFVKFRYKPSTRIRCARFCWDLLLHSLAVI